MVLRCGFLNNQRLVASCSSTWGNSSFGVLHQDVLWRVSWMRWQKWYLCGDANLSDLAHPLHHTNDGLVVQCQGMFKGRWLVKFRLITHHKGVSSLRWQDMLVVIIQFEVLFTIRDSFLYVFERLMPHAQTPLFLCVSFSLAPRYMLGLPTDGGFRIKYLSSLLRTGMALQWMHTLSSTWIKI